VENIYISFAMNLLMTIHVHVYTILDGCVEDMHMTKYYVFGSQCK